MAVTKSAMHLPRAAVMAGVMSDSLMMMGRLSAIEFDPITRPRCTGRLRQSLDLHEAGRTCPGMGAAHSTARSAAALDKGRDAHPENVYRPLLIGRLGHAWR